MREEMVARERPAAAATARPRPAKRELRHDVDQAFGREVQLELIPAAPASAARGANVMRRPGSG